jgi:hypothetical protein
MAENKALDKNVRYDRQLRLWGQWGQDQLQVKKIHFFFFLFFAFLFFRPPPCFFVDRMVQR